MFSVHSTCLQLIIILALSSILVWPLPNEKNKSLRLLGVASWTYHWGCRSKGPWSPQYCRRCSPSPLPSYIIVTNVGYGYQLHTRPSLRRVRHWRFLSWCIVCSTSSICGRSSSSGLENFLLKRIWWNHEQNQLHWQLLKCHRGLHPLLSSASDLFQSLASTLGGCKVE